MREFAKKILTEIAAKQDNSTDKSRRIALDRLNKIVENPTSTNRQIIDAFKAAIAYIQANGKFGPKGIDGSFFIKKANEFLNYVYAKPATINTKSISSSSSSTTVVPPAVLTSTVVLTTAIESKTMSISAASLRDTHAITSTSSAMAISSDGKDEVSLTARLVEAKFGSDFPVSPSQFLPKLIFGETHTDPTTARILGKLMPKLRALGYQDFYDETASTTTLQSMLTYFGEESDRYHQIKSGQDRYHMLDMSGAWGRYSRSEATMMLHEAQQAWSTTFKLMQACGTHYRGIDLPQQKSLFGERAMYARDKKMAKAYLAAHYPVFGRIGLDHAEGIQKEILRNQSEMVANAQYCFFLSDSGFSRR